MSSFVDDRLQFVLTKEGGKDIILKKKNKKSVDNCGKMRLRERETESETKREKERELTFLYQTNSGRNRTKNSFRHKKHFIIILKRKNLFLFFTKKKLN